MKRVLVLLLAAVACGGGLSSTQVKARAYIDSLTLTNLQLSAAAATANKICAAPDGDALSLLAAETYGDAIQAKAVAAEMVLKCEAKSRRLYAAP